MADSDDMSPWTRFFLLIDLLVWNVLLLYATYGLWGAVAPAGQDGSASPEPGTWEFFGWDWTVSLDLRLLLLVLFTGGFGASVAGLNSLVNFRGSQRLTASWTMFYVARPAIGAGVAFAIYLVIRGGLLAGSEIDFEAVTPYGILAASVLAGMFSDTAMLKLKEVFDTLFKPKDDRPDKMTALVIETAKLPDAQVGLAYSEQLMASGGTPPYAWSVDPALPAGLALAADTGVVSGTPHTVTAKTAYTFKVTDANGESATADLELEVTP